MAAAVEAFLERQGLSQYASTLLDNGFDDMSMLLDAEDTDFLELDLLLGHRRKLLKALARERESCLTVGSPSVGAPVSEQAPQSPPQQKVCTPLVDLASGKQDAQRNKAASKHVTPLYKNDAAVDVPEGSISREALLSNVSLIEFPVNEVRKILKDGSPFLGFAIGLVRDFFGNLCMSRQHNAGPQLTRLLTRWVQQEHPNFEFTSVYSNKNVLSRLHVDKHNQGLSLFVELGTSWGLWVYDPEGDTEIVVSERLPKKWSDLLPLGSRARGRVLHGESFFDGLSPHMTMEPKEGDDGDRYSLIFYCVSGADCVQGDAWQRLKNMGFNPPKPSRNRLPEAVCTDLNRDACEEDDVESGNVLPRGDELATAYDIKATRPGQDESELIKLLEQELLHKNKHTALRSIRFDGQMALIIGLCQMGKSGEISLAAWLSVFKYKALPIVFVKNMGGREAQAQLAGNIARFNQEVSHKLATLTGWGPDSRLCRGFHLTPITDVAEYRKGSDQQVLILLSNPPQIRSVKAKVAPDFKLPDGKLRIVCIFDEDDTNTTSFERNSSKIEEELFGQWDDGPSLRERALQVFSVTATAGAVAFAETKPVQISMMPIRPDYYGLSPKLPDERRPKFKAVLAEDMEEDEALGFPKGVASMIQDMLLSSAECVGLVHIETRIEGHKRLQEAILRQFARDRIVVVTHNGGSNYLTRKAGYIDKEVSAEGNRQQYHIETNFPLTCMGSLRIQPVLASFLERTLGKDDDRHRVVDGVHRFEKNLRIMDVLTTLCRFRAEEVADGNGEVIRIILSGNAGGRGTTFRDETHTNHVTDLFVARDASNPSGEYLIQLANRVAGTFQQAPSRLQWWTSQDMHDTIISHMHRLDEVMQLLRKEGGRPLREILAENPDYLKLTALPGGSNTRPRITRRKIDHAFCERSLKNTDGGNCHVKHGGGNVTELVLALAQHRTRGGELENLDVQERRLQLLVQKPEDKDLRCVARKVYPDVADVANIEIVTLDQARIIKFDELPDEIRKMSSDDSLQENEQKRLTIMLREHLHATRAECLRSEERYGRAGSIMRENMPRNDYCDLVIQMDKPRNRLLALRKELSYEDFISRRDAVNPETAKTVIFAWRAFSPMDAFPVVDWIFARRRDCEEARLEYKPNAKKQRLSSSPATAVPSSPGEAAASSSSDATTAMGRARQECENLLSLKAGLLNQAGGASCWREQVTKLKSEVEKLSPAKAVALAAEIQNMMTNFKSNTSKWRVAAQEILKKLEDC